MKIEVKVHGPDIPWPGRWFELGGMDYIVTEVKPELDGPYLVTSESLVPETYWVALRFPTGQESQERYAEEERRFPTKVTFWERLFS